MNTAITTATITPEVKLFSRFLNILLEGAPWAGS